MDMNSALSMQPLLSPVHEMNHNRENEEKKMDQPGQ